MRPALKKAGSLIDKALQPITPPLAGQAYMKSNQYKEYLEKMHKDIHDDKMARFVATTQKLDEAVPKSPPPKREI